MTQISAINNFKTNHLTPLTNDPQKKENTEKAATVVGSTGFVATATKYASKRGLRGQSGEKIIQAGEKTLQTMMESVQESSRIAGKGMKEATGFFAKFKKDASSFAEDFMRFAGKLKNNKIIEPIINSPITKKAAGAFGGGMAFFVLVTGVSKAAENGSLAINDLKNKYYEMKY